jgi:hypothetical protein
MISINKFFSSRAATWLCLIIAVLSRVINVLFVSYAGRDKMFHVLQSQSLLHGHGLSIPQYYTHNLITPVYDFTPQWPPGYPILLAPFLKIFNYDIYWATTTLDIIICIALIFTVRGICKQTGMPAAAVNIMTLIAGCFEYTFINESLPTDTISLVVFLFGLSLTIKFISSEYFSLRTASFASLFLFLPCFFRYNYPAISLGVAAFIVAIGLMNKDSLLRKKGLVLFIMTASLTACFFIVMKLATGHAGYAAPTQRGFYPENIVHWFPVVPSSYINLAFLTSQGIRFTGVSFETLMLVLEAINVFCILLLIWLFIRLLRKKEFFQAFRSFNWFLVSGFVASVFLFAVLGYVSLTYAVQRGFLHDWNYVYEARYFAFANIFLQIAFIGWLFLYGQPKNIFIRIIAWMLAILLFIEVTHNIYFHTKVALNFKEYKSGVYREKDYSAFFSLIRDLEKKYEPDKIWVAAPGDDFYYYAATYLGHKGIANAKELKTGFPEAKTKTAFLFVLYDHEIAAHTNILEKTGAVLSLKVGFTNFYTAELGP